MKSFVVNWKTSSAGIAAILSGVSGVIQLLSTNPPVMSVLTSPALATVIGGVGLLFAKDGNVTGGTIAQATVPNPPVLPAPTVPAKA